MYVLSSLGPSCACKGAGIQDTYSSAAARVPFVIVENLIMCDVLIEALYMSLQNITE